MSQEESRPPEVGVEAWPDPIFTVSLIVANVAIFLLMVARGVSFWTTTELQSLQWGANFGPLTLGGQYCGSSPPISSTSA